MKRGLDVDSFGKFPASSNVELALFQSTAMGSHSHVLKMPWELNPTLTSLFSGNNTPWLNGVKVPRLLPSVSSTSCSTQTMDMDSKRSLIRTFCFRAAARRDDAERAQVILKWVELILLCPTASTGLQLIAEKADAVNSDKRFLVVSDALVPKSTSTLKTRAGSLALYVKWLESKHPGEKYLPFCESKVYDNMCDLRTAACAASQGSTFVGTLGFVGELLGMQGTDACISSGRVKGASLDMYLGKRVLRQAPALEPIMLAILELACFCERATHLRAIAGFCVACVYGRLRVSDLNRLVHLSEIGGYAEGSLMRVKTARAKEKQCTFLPVVIPTTGLLGVNWFQAFVQTRRNLQLADIPTLESQATDKSFGILPSAATAHLDIFAKISTTEVTDGMKRILGKCLPDKMISALTSHSLKATLLTYYEQIRL